MKKIGIVGWNTGENSFGVTKPYLEWLANYGTVEIITPQKGMVQGLDLLILPGGLDMSASLAGNVPSYYNSNIDVMKQYFYDVNLQQYIDADVPIFGICLGFQQLCVKFGGTLIQNYGFNSSLKSRGELVDTLQFTQNFNKYYVHNVKEKVNSLHHQGCFDLNPEMIIAIESKLKNIEVAKFSEKIYGVQYHPEEIYDEVSDIIMNILLNF
jgi:putative glutamine amidotransferase